jgi:parallel beta-helix repeat protein
MQWNKQYGGTDRDSAQFLVKTFDGGYAIAGYTHSFGAGSIDAWLVKTDASGNMEWNKTYGETDRDLAYSLVQTSDGGFAIAGQTYSTGAGEGDFWLVKTDVSGNIQWSQTYGGTGTEGIFASLIQTFDGGYALAGETSSFGAGSQDFWLLKTDENGVVPDFRVYIRADGTVEGTDKIQRDGNTYTFTDDIFNEIIVEKDAITVDGNGYTLSGPRSGVGFDLTGANNVTIQNTNIQDFRYGIVLQASFYASISGNHIRNNHNGIDLTYSYDNNIFGNTITSNNYGIRFSGGSHNMISGNAITGNSDGFQMYGSHNTISQNIISNNSWNGFILRHSSMYNVIRENIIKNNKNLGISLMRATFNIIRENNITDNTNGMFFHLQSSNNMIYSNNFANNMQILIENGSTNDWDNGAAGNYWNNYNDTDSDGDGIGDTPYVIDENNQDDYPLVRQHVITEIPLWIIPPIFVAVTLFALITKERLQSFSPKTFYKRIALNK